MEEPYSFKDNHGGTAGLLIFILLFRIRVHKLIYTCAHELCSALNDDKCRPILNKIIVVAVFGICSYRQYRDRVGWGTTFSGQRYKHVQ